ncbi:MAG: SLC13 family permease [Lysobacteraceae bacterium]|nr:MAG: SLC13 family permease [Xanthomonadaceae bacterium]
MTVDQIILFVLIVTVFVFLIWGKFRYDMVAFSALIIAAGAGVIPSDQVFAGFGHPAVIIIALVLMVSRGLSRSGAIEVLARHLLSASSSLRGHVGRLAGAAAVLSGVMNNVAALALLMPIDLQAAARAKRSPALSLMPIAFASILGGMVTLIGTPPNIVIATFRESALGEPYSMFDFAPVGGIVALVGVIFIVLFGWRLIPKDRGKHNTGEELLDLDGYLAEAKVPKDAKIVGHPVRDLDTLAEDNEVSVLGVVRRGKRLPGFARRETVKAGDYLVVEGGPAAIDQFVGAAGLQYDGAEKQIGIAADAQEVVEVVVPAGSRIDGRSAMDVRLLYRQGVTLLGISRKGKRFRDRVRKIKIEAGDILLLLGPEERLSDVVSWLGCLPLAERGIEFPQRRKAWIAVGAFVLAIIAASVGWLYLPLALAAVVIIFIGLKIVPLSQVYDSVEWPVLVLLGSMIPIGAALESSGGTALIANSIVNWTDGLPTIAVLTILMIITMTLSDVLNNVATALIAAPIGIDIANRLGANPDPFLMAVAVAASCAFLTPIGHKNNTIIMGPGGYHFGDYWRLGLPLEILVVAVSIPMIVWVWPL